MAAPGLLFAAEDGWTETHRPEWVHVPAGDPNLEFYIDRASAQIRNSGVEFWDVVIFDRPTQRDETSERWVKEKRTLRRVRCEEGQQALLRGSSFDEGGHLIEAIALPSEGVVFSSVRPGTVAAAEIYRVCKDLGLPVPDVLVGPATPVDATGRGIPLLPPSGSQRDGNGLRIPAEPAAPAGPATVSPADPAR